VIIKLGHCPKKNRNCANREFVICDTNYFIFILEYIFYNYIKNDLNNWIRDFTNIKKEKPTYRQIEVKKRALIFNMFIPINDVINQFKEFLRQSSECSVNNSINVTERLFLSELDILGNNRNSIERKTLIFRKFPAMNVKRKIANIFNQYLNKTEKVVDQDVDNTYSRAQQIFVRQNTKPPGKKDISLIFLGLKKTHNQQFQSILVTEDSKLQLLHENHLRPERTFNSHSGSTWNTRNLKVQNIILFLGNIFRCCERTDLEEMVAFYKEFLANLMRKIKHEDTRAAKVRMLVDVIGDCSDYIRLKPQTQGVTP